MICAPEPRGPGVARVQRVWQAGKEFGPSMIKIKARPNESVEQLLRRLKKMCEKEGLNKEIKRNSYYEKPSERRRRKLRKAQKRTAQRQAEWGRGT